MQSVYIRCIPCICFNIPISSRKLLSLAFVGTSVLEKKPWSSSFLPSHFSGKPHVKFQPCLGSAHGQIPWPVIISQWHGVKGLSLCLLAACGSWVILRYYKHEWLCWVTRSFSLACQILFWVNPLVHFLWVEFGLLLSLWASIFGYLCFCCFRMRLRIPWDPFKKLSQPWRWQNTLIELSFLVLPYSLQLLGGGLGQDLLLTGCQAVHHITSVECAHGKSYVQGHRRPWISSFPSKSLLGWLSHFLSCWSHPWKGFEVWSVFDVSFCPCQSLLRRQQALSSLCKWVFESVCLPSCCVSLLSLWCLSSMVPCMPHPVPGM